MPDKHRLELEASTEATAVQGPVPSSYATTISALAALFSAIALWVSINNSKRTDRVERINQFEREYGSELRTLFRKFDALVAALDAFTIPTATPHSQTLSELQGIATDLELISGKIVRVLREMDDDETVKWGDWEAKFTALSAEAQRNLDGAFDITSSQDLLLRRVVDKAQDSYSSGARLVRRRLRRAAGKKSYPK